MRVLVVGAGLYVLGRGTSRWGTVLPALAQASKQLAIEHVTIASTSIRGHADVERAAGEVNRQMGTALRVEHRVLNQVLSTGLASNFDCAIVSVPDHLHFEIGRQMLESDLHCLMVKPFVATTREGRELIAIAEQRGLYGAVEFHKRFDEANLIVRRMVSAGALGSLAYATVEYSQRISVPADFFASWASRTNIFQYLGVHYVDLLHFISGCRPTRLAALGQRGILAARGIDTYDSVHVVMQWDGTRQGAAGFISQFAVGWVDPECSTAMSDQRYLLVGSGGRIECDQKSRGLRVVGPAGRVEEVNPYFSEYLPGPGDALDFAGYGYRSIERYLRDVLDVKARRVEPSSLEGQRPTFRSAMVSTAVIQAVRESLAAGGEWKAVDEAP